MLPLTLKVRTTATGPVVEVGGALDFETAQDFHDLLPTLTLHRDQRLALDLGAVEFFDSSGIRALLAALDLAASGAGLTLLSVPDHIWRVLDAVGLKDRCSRRHPTPDWVTGLLRRAAISCCAPDHPGARTAWYGLPFPGQEADVMTLVPFRRRGHRFAISVAPRDGGLLGQHPLSAVQTEKRVGPAPAAAGPRGPL